MNLPHILITAWWYFHGHLQDNILASVAWAGPGYLFGRYHLKKLHHRLDAQSAKLKLIHKHLKETRNT